MPRGSHAGARQARRRTAQPRSRRSRVEPSTSVKRNVTVPRGDRAHAADHAAAIQRCEPARSRLWRAQIGADRGRPRRRPARPGCRSWPQRRDPGGRGRRKRRCGGRHSGEFEAGTREPRSAEPRPSSFRIIFAAEPKERCDPDGRDSSRARRKMATCQAGPTSRRVSGTRPCSRAIRSIASLERINARTGFPEVQHRFIAKTMNLTMCVSRG